MLFQSRVSSAVRDPQTPTGRLALWRIPLRQLSFARLLTGGRITDAGRLPRYAGVFLIGAAAIWAPITGYLQTAPLRYTSYMSLILPGSGASASVNLNDIGQASSFANSAFSSNSISPTETYKRLIGAERILIDAANLMGMQRRDFGTPRINLVDQTGLIHLQMVGNSPEDAQQRGEAVLAAFFTELSRLRRDEQVTREDGGLEAIRDYRASIQETRDAIADLQRQTGLFSAQQYLDQVSANEVLRGEVDRLGASLQKRTGAAQMLQAKLGLTPDQAAAGLKLFADSEYLAMVQQMSAQAAELADLNSRFGSQHPLVTRARTAYQTERRDALARGVAVTNLSVQALGQIDVAPDGARAELLAELVRQEMERAGLEAQWAEMSARFDRESTRLERMAPMAARLEDMQRDFAVAEAVFASAIARTQSSKSDIYASYPLVQVLENPTLAQEPSSPRRKMAIGAGIAATLMVLIGLSLGWVRVALIGRLLKKGTAQ
ncbi:MAG: GumC family protein [Thalassovita sp.]